MNIYLFTALAIILLFAVVVIAQTTIDHFNKKHKK